MIDAGMDDKTVSAFDEADLLNLHAGGYRTSVAFERAREKDLKACGAPPALIGVLFGGARVQGEHVSSSMFPIQNVHNDMFQIMVGYHDKHHYLLIFHKPKGMSGGGLGASRGETS